MRTRSRSATRPAALAAASRTCPTARPARTRGRWSCLAVGLLLLGCGGGGGDNFDGGKPPKDGPTADAPPATRLVWSFVVVDEANAGHQPEIARAPDGSLAVAYYRARPEQPGTCSRLTGNPPVPSYDLVYAAEQPGGQFTTEVVATFDILNLQGLALAFDGAGNPAIAFMGGAEGQYRCGGTDIMLARRSGGSWNVVTVDSDGMGDPVFQEDEDQCVAYQNTCRAATQDVVGPWPGLAFAGSEPLIAYRDIHFGFAQDDEEKADLELARGSGFALATLDAVRGGGVYTRLLADDAGNPVVAHYNPYTNYNGVWVEWNDGSAWQRTRAVTGPISIGYKLGFARAGSRYGLAYYPPRQGRLEIEQKLWYVDSADGVTWGDAEVVDQQGDTGQSPSLAFDPAGRPAISYYRCRSQYDPDTSDCDIGKDALKYAVKGSTWESVVVRETSGYDGIYTALAFDRDGLPAIAFQARYLDPTTQTVINQLVVARSQVQ